MGGTNRGIYQFSYGGSPTAKLKLNKVGPRGMNRNDYVTIAVTDAGDYPGGDPTISKITFTDAEKNSIGEIVPAVTGHIKSVYGTGVVLTSIQKELLAQVAVFFHVSVTSGGHTYHSDPELINNAREGGGNR